MNDAHHFAPVQGHAEPAFARVRECFAAHFSAPGPYQEQGAALAVYQHGRCVLDLWGGYADRAGQRPWQRDSLVNVYSTSKGLVATLAALLVERGQLRYQDPVTRYWPEFGQAGKQDCTVAQLLSHQAGLTGFVRPTALEDLYDWDACCAALAAQAPFWPPGTQSSYHAMTWGYLVGEVLRRASGLRPGGLMARELAAPLQAEIYLGLPEHLEARCAQMLAPRVAPDLGALTQPPQALAALVNPQLEGEVCNARAWRAAQIPAANVQASAQGVARVYALLANGGVLDGARLLSSATLARLSTVQAQRIDLLLGFSGNWAMGFSYNQMGLFGPRAKTFGHSGWGGSFGCADFETGIAIGYVCNQMGPNLVGDPRGAGLCQAVFDCLS